MCACSKYKCHPFILCKGRHSFSIYKTIPCNSYICITNALAPQQKLNLLKQ